MDEVNTLKEKIKVIGDDLRTERQLTVEKDEQLQAAKEKIKAIAVKAVKTFQQTKDLLRYLVKHPTGANLGNLDLEDVDKEILRTSVTYIRPGGILLLSQFWLRQ